MKIEFTTRGLLTVFFRQRWKCLAVFMLVAWVGVLYLTFARPQYEASGSLLVKFGQNATPDVTHPDNRAQIISQNDRREIVQSDMEILQGHSLLLSVVRSIGAEKLYPGITASVAGVDRPEEAAIKRLWKSDLIVKSSQQSNLIEVQVINEDPDLTADFVRRLFSTFISRQSEVFNKPQTDFLQSQVKLAASKLERSQQKLEDFKAKNGISSIEAELAELLRQKADTGTVSLESMDDAWARIAELQSKETQMLMTYQPDSPQMQRAHQAVVQAKVQLEQRRADLLSRTDTATTKINRRIAELESQRKQYNDLVRQVEIDEDNYKNYELKSEDARISETLNQNSITPIAIVDEPVAPMRPIYPRKLLTIALTLLAGVTFSTGTALAFETFDPRFTTPEQVAQALGLPVMASFSAEGNV